MGRSTVHLSSEKRTSESITRQLQCHQISVTFRVERYATNHRGRANSLCREAGGEFIGSFDGTRFLVYSKAERYATRLKGTLDAPCEMDGSGGKCIHATVLLLHLYYEI